MPVYIGNKQMSTCYLGNKELSAIYVGSKEVWSNWPLKTYYNYGDADGSLNYTQMSYGATRYRVTQLDGTPATVTNSSTAWCENIKYGNAYVNLVESMVPSSHRTDVPSGEYRGTLTCTSTNTSIERSYFFRGYEDEGDASRMCRTEIKYNDTWHSLQVAITDKKIKPLVLIGLGCESGESLSGGLSAIMTGGNVTKSGYTYAFAILIQANFGVQAVRVTSDYWENGYAYSWDTVNARVTYDNKTYKKSLYNEKYW